MALLVQLIAGLLLVQASMLEAFNMSKLARQFGLRQTMRLPSVLATNAVALPGLLEHAADAPVSKNSTGTDCSEEQGQVFMFCILLSELVGNTTNDSLGQLRGRPGFNESAECMCSNAFLEVSGGCSRNLTTLLGVTLFMADFLSCNTVPGHGDPCGGNGKLFQDAMACSDANGLEGPDVDFELGSARHQTWCGCMLPFFDGVSSTCAPSTPMGQLELDIGQNATVQAALHACPSAGALLLP